MRLKWQKAIYPMICSTIIFFIAIFTFNLPCKWANSQQNRLLFLWPELRSEGGTAFKLSPDRKWIWYAKAGEPGMVIHRLRDDLSLGEKVHDTNNRRKDRKELELGAWWMAENKLLVYLVEGVSSEEELEYKLARHNEDPETNPAPSFKLLVLNPLTGEETPFPVTVDYGPLIMPHPDRDKVLIEGNETTILYSFPNAKELAQVTVGHGFFLAWCPDKQRFWGLVAYLNDHTWVTRIVVTDVMQNQRKILLEKEWNNERYSIQLEPIGEAWGKDSIGNLRLDSYQEATLVDGQELAILVYKQKADKMTFVYFSSDGIARERELTEKMLPDALKQLGECWLIAMVPNGRELLIRQGVHHPNDQQWQKCWYWLWDMDNGSVKRIGYFGELTVIEWLSPQEAIIEMRSIEDVDGEEKVFCDYGILRLP